MRKPLMPTLAALVVAAATAGVAIGAAGGGVDHKHFQYAIGDWPNCDRASNGSFNSRERLEHERGLFFAK